MHFLPLKFLGLEEMLSFMEAGESWHVDIVSTALQFCLLYKKQT